MLNVTFDELAKLLGVTERRQCTVDKADDLGKVDLRGRTAQPIPALRATDAFHHASILQFEQDELEEFLGQPFVVSNVADANCALVVAAGQAHHGL